MQHHPSPQRGRKESSQDSSFDQNPLEKESGQGAVPRTMAPAPFQLQASEADANSQGATESLLLDTEDSGGASEAPVQAKLASSGPIQRMEAPIQRKGGPTVPVKIIFSGTLNFEQFQQAVMKQLFGGPVTGLEWNGFTAATYTSPYTVNVAVSLLKSNRGQQNAQKGIPTSDDGGVEGSQGLREGFKKMPAGADKEGIMNEIDKRYYEASGDEPGKKLGNGPQDAGKRELWKQIQDEVLFQNEYIRNLPDGVKQFIKYSTDGKVLTAADLEQLFRIAKTLEAMPPDIAHEYLSRVTGSTTDLDKFEQSLHHFREEMDKQRAFVEENNITREKIVGLEAIYKKYRTYKSLMSSASTMSALGGLNGGGDIGTGLGTTMVAMDVYKEVDEACKAHGFSNGISDFEKFIGQFEVGFEKHAQLTAIGYLEKFQGALYKEQQNYNDNALMTDLLAKIKAGTDKETLAKSYAIFNDKDLPDDKKVDLERLKSASSAAALGGMLSGYATARSTDIGEAKGQISGDSKVIYKLTNLMPIFYVEQNIGADSIYDMIIHDKMHSDLITRIVVGIATALVAIALTVISLGAATPALIAAGAAAMSFGLSAFGVYEAYRDYALEKDLADVGLANDPSMVWVIIAVAGAVLDMGAAVRAVSKLGPAAKIAQVSGDLAEFDRIVAIMKKAGGLDAQAAIAAEKAMAAQLGFKESKAAFDALVSANGAKSFLQPEMYIELVKMAKFKSMQGGYTLVSFVDDIRATRKLKGLGDLSAEEITKIKQAWNEGRASARVAGEALEASDQLVTTMKSSLQARISAMPKFELRYTDVELKALITKGRTSGFTAKEIEDLILVGARKDKPLNAIQLMDQMDFAVYLKGRGYPAKFKSLADFNDFSSTLKSEISAIGGPTSDIRIQGSSLRTAAANDVDLVAMMSESNFDDIIKRAYAGRLKEGGVAVDFASLDHAGLDALLARIKANPKSFTAIRKDFQYVYENKMINSKMMKSEIKAVFNAEGMLKNIQDKFPHLNIENVSFQIPGGAFDLQPFLRL